MKKLAVLFVSLVLLLCLSSIGIAERCGDFEYTVLDDGTIQITKYRGSDTTLSIPDALDGHSVTAIGDQAFSYRKSLTSITIPDRVTSIGNSAFSYCNSLTSIIIPDSVTSIGNAAFDDCSSLTNISLPDSIISLGTNPFRKCTQLSRIQVSPDHPYLALIDGVLFSKADKRLVSYRLAKTDAEYTIPQGIKTIGTNAFAFSEHLTSITIPDSVTSIDDYAFFACESLTSIVIPDSITSIGVNPFRNCSQLNHIQVASDHPFLALIDGVLFSKDDERLVSYLRAKTDVNYAIPQGIKIIGGQAFASCRNLTSITIPDSVTSIDTMAFPWCESLTSITIPDSVTSIGAYAFVFCKNLTSITIPGSVTSIGNGAFSRCENLNTITIPDSVTFIGDYVFSQCNNLTNIIVARDSYAAQYCKENNLPYTYPDSNDWLNN